MKNRKLKRKIKFQLKTDDVETFVAVLTKHYNYSKCDLNFLSNNGYSRKPCLWVYRYSIPYLSTIDVNTECSNSVILQNMVVLIFLAKW